MNNELTRCALGHDTYITKSINIPGHVLEVTSVHSLAVFRAWGSVPDRLFCQYS